MKQSRALFGVTKRAAGFGAAVIASALVLSGCSSASPDGDALADEDRTLTVWFMQTGAFLDVTVPEVNKRFEELTGASVKVEVQQWDNIVTKLTTALSSDNPPDVVQIGNTNIQLFAANGAVRDLTDVLDELKHGVEWNESLESPSVVDGKVYAAPLRVSTYAIVYNKKMWADAGVVEEPETWEQFTAALDAVKAKNPATDFSALYLAGADWQSSMPFIYDAGGSFATLKGDEWVADVDSAKSIKGLEQYKEFQNTYSAASSQTASSTSPEGSSVMAELKASASIAGNPSVIVAIESGNPDIAGEIGSFPMPSMNNTGELAPVMAAGSVVSIAAKSKNADLATEYIKLLTSPEIQQDFVGLDNGAIPISPAYIDAIIDDVPEIHQAFYAAGKSGITLPASAGWATLEADNTLSDLFVQIATGARTVDEASKKFADHLNKVLNVG